VYWYVPAATNVKEYVWPGPTKMLLLVKLGEPSDSTLCDMRAVFTQVHVTVPPTTTVSTAGFVVLLRLLLNRMLPTVTLAVAGAGATATAVALKVRGDPVRPPAVAVMVIGPAVPPSVTFTAEFPATLVATEGLDTDAVPLAIAQATAKPSTPFPC
jgi:hypothetical protein